MFEFAYPWAFWFLPLPILVWWILPAYAEAQAAIRVPFFQTLVELTGARPREGAARLRRTLVQRLLISAMWILLVFGLARPELVGEPIEQIKASRDLMIAVDLSGSMEQQDFVTPEADPISRIAAVKNVLQAFALAREHDRLGLIVFGQSPYLQSPFTADHDAWLQLLEESEIGMAGLNTALGDAIGLAVRVFQNTRAEDRVLIVLTDGNDTGSRVPPIDAAKVAQHENVRIYMIAVGDPATTGEEALDTKTMERVAELTGGDFFHAHDHNQLEEIHRQILEREPEEYERLAFRPRRTLFHVPLGAAVLLALLVHGLLAWTARRNERLAADD